MPQSACAASTMETAPGPLGTTELIFSGAKDGLTYVFLNAATSSGPVYKEKGPNK